MGLFQKNKSSDKPKDELHDYVDNLLEESKDLTNDEIDEKFSVEAMALKSQYGIDQAIELMRDLPADASSIVVSTVTRTLESAHIDVQKIIDDANQKETALAEQINDLNEQIKSLKDEITVKKEQISVSSAVLEETKKVRELLVTAKNEKAEARKNKNKSSNVSSIKEAEAVKMALEAQ